MDSLNGLWMFDKINSIIDLEKKIKNLYETDKTTYSILKRIYKFDFDEGCQIIPDSFKTKVLNYFGLRNASGEIIETTEEVINRIEHQKIINIKNKWTDESTLFNSLRADRPGIRGKDVEKEKNFVQNLILDSAKTCDFCLPEKYTPEDVFGRIHGKHSITAANLAKYDVWSGLVIFNRHNPLKFTLEELSDYIKTGFGWFDEVNKHNPKFRFPFFIWNCLPRAGASQLHGHCQIMMSKDPYSKVGILRETYQKYEKETGTDYFKDLSLIFSSLELSGNQGDIFYFTNITPIKEKEVIIISPKNPSKDINAKETIFKILRCFIDIMGVFSFNLSISCPSLNEEELPYIIRIVDRGSLLKSTADMGGMELYGSSVVAEDPYNVIKIINSVF